MNELFRDRIAMLAPAAGLVASSGLRILDQDWIAGKHRLNPVTVTNNGVLVSVEVIAAAPDDALADAAEVSSSGPTRCANRPPPECGAMGHVREGARGRHGALPRRIGAGTGPAVRLSSRNNPATRKEQTPGPVEPRPTGATAGQPGIAPHQKNNPSRTPQATTSPTRLDRR